MQVARWHPWHVHWGERKASRMMVRVALPAKGLLYRARQNNNVDKRWWRACTAPALIAAVTVLNWWWDYTCSSDTYNHPLWNTVSKPKHPFPSCFKGPVTDTGPEKQSCYEIHERRKAERFLLIPRRFYFIFENFSRADGIAAVKPPINHSLCLAETTQMCHNTLAAHKFWLHISRCNKLLHPVAVYTASLSQKCCPGVIMWVCSTPAGRNTATSNQQIEMCTIMLLCCFCSTYLCTTNAKIHCLLLLNWCRCCSERVANAVHQWATYKFPKRRMQHLLVISPRSLSPPPPVTRRCTRVSACWPAVILRTWEKYQWTWFSHLDILFQP